MYIMYSEYLNTWFVEMCSYASAEIWPPLSIGDMQCAHWSEKDEALAKFFMLGLILGS